MKTLSESIKYTKEKKHYQLTKMENNFHKRPTEIFYDYLNDNLSAPGIVALNIQRQSTWYLWRYINDAFNSILNYELLAKNTKYAVLSNAIYYLVGTKVPKYDSYVMLQSATMHLGQMLFLGWDDRAIKYGKFLMMMLDSKHYKGGTTYPLYQWFIIKLFCLWQNIELDRSKLRMPDDLGIYDVALKNLTSVDTELVRRIVNEMTEYHILNSDEYVQTDEYGNETSAEFDSADYFVFPVEILMFLMIRERLGMPKTNIGGNELLSRNLNRIPDIPIKYPSHDIVDDIFGKLYTDNPDYPKM
jgi:hypothetical protein